VDYERYNRTDFIGMEKMSNNDNYYPEILRALLAGSKPLAPNPFPPTPFPVINAPRPPALGELVRALARPVKQKPPELSVEHMRELLSESVTKKLDVNPGRQLPTIYDLAIGEGRQLNAAFVYADLDGYSKLVATKGTGVSFQLLQVFVNLAEKITAHFNGTVVDCAGDRTLSVFHRASQDRSCEPIREAITAALWIQTAIAKVISPHFAAQKIPVQASIGIDYSAVTAGCVGVRGSKRLVFLGEAANNAAKLQEQGVGGETIFSPLVFEYRPNYLNNSSWYFTEKRDAFGRSAISYKTAQHFRDDEPLAKALYLK
jgi:adenylate cyclase